MNTMDSIQNTVKAAIVIVGCTILNCAPGQADPPSPETFNKASELILTLSGDPTATEKALRPFRPLDTAIKNKPDRFIARKDNKRPINMNCGMKTNPYADTDNSFINRLSGACDLSYNY